VPGLIRVRPGTFRVGLPCSLPLFEKSDGEEPPEVESGGELDSASLEEGEHSEPAVVDESSVEGEAEVAKVEVSKAAALWESHEKRK
jgi:hypothetical protein